MTLTGIHGYVLGFAVIGVWAVICVWALVLRFASQGDTPVFWRALSVAQILLVVQLLVGLLLLGAGARPGPEGGGRTLGFHLAYGIVFPLVVLVAGHWAAREGRYRAHSVFALVGLVIFGLTARAWMVGTGGV